jgi:hypothetical protein
MLKVRPSRNWYKRRYRNAIVELRGRGGGPPGALQMICQGYREELTGALLVIFQGPCRGHLKGSEEKLSSVWSGSVMDTAEDPVGALKVIFHGPCPTTSHRLAEDLSGACRGRLKRFSEDLARTLQLEDLTGVLQRIPSGVLLRACQGLSR